MKISLCTSPHLDHNFYYQEHSTGIVTLPFVPLGLLSLAACLEKRCEEVEIIDLNQLIGTTIPNDRDFYRNIATLIQGHNPDILGFMTEADSYHHILAISKECKKLLPRVIIVLGGPHASVTDYETLKDFPCIDMVVRGEGEVSMVELVEALRRDGDIGSVRGISHRTRNGAVIRNEDRPLIEGLDSLPVPAYHLYNISPTDTVYLEVGRGCPYACTFCFTAPYWKRQYRVKSPERVFSEMGLLLEKYHIRHFNLVHDLLTVDRRWVERFCTGLLERNLGVTWTCSSRVDTVDAELIGLMSRSGCKAIYYGLEVGSRGMQKAIKKRLDPQRALDIIRQTMSQGIEVTVGLMLGFPQESENSIRKTLRLFFSLLKMEAPKVHIFRVCPFRGSPMHEDCKGSLYFDGHFLDIPLCKTLQEENLALMRRYPEMFSGYYRYRTRLDDEDFLKGIDELSPIMGTLRYPILSILETSGDGLGLLKAWAQWISNHNRNHRPAKSLTHYGTAEEFLLFLRDTTQGNGRSEYVADLIQYEKIKNDFRKAVAPASGLSTRDSAKQRRPRQTTRFPKKTKYVRIKKFKYDVKRIIEQIRSGTVSRIEKQGCYIMFFTDSLGELNTAKINRLGAELIRLCNGRQSLQAIASRFASTETSRADRMHENIISAVKTLKEMNVIEGETDDCP